MRIFNEDARIYFKPLRRAEAFPAVEAFAVSSSAYHDEVQNLVMLASKSKYLTARRA